MRKFTAYCLTLFLITCFSHSFAVPPGMNIEYSNNPIGPVIFSGDVHAKKKLSCDHCHPKLFKQKTGSAKIDLASHHDGKTFCFSCHNDKVAFASAGNCARCHQGKP